MYIFLVSALEEACTGWKRALYIIYEHICPTPNSMHNEDLWPLFCHCNHQASARIS